MSPSARGTPSGSSSSPSSGNESPSVSSSMPRWSLFSSRISSGPTQVIPSSPSRTPSASSTRRATSAAASSSTSAPLRFVVSTEINARAPDVMTRVETRMPEPARRGRREPQYVTYWGDRGRGLAGSGAASRHRRSLRQELSTAPGRAGLLGVPLVRLDDPLHELVPDDVLVPELDEGDALDIAEDLAD